MMLDIEGVLARHVLITTGQPRSPSSWNRACSCDEPMPWDMEKAAPAHRAHVAAVLREQIAAWLGSEGAANAAQVGVHAIESCEPDPSVEQYAASVLAALAAQVAPSRVSGEGS